MITHGTTAHRILRLKPVLDVSSFLRMAVPQEAPPGGPSAVFNPMLPGSDSQQRKKKARGKSKRRAVLMHFVSGVHQCQW